MLASLFLASPCGAAGADSSSGGYTSIDGDEPGSGRSSARRPREPGRAAESESGAASGISDGGAASGNYESGEAEPPSASAPSRRPESYVEAERDYFDSNYIRNCVFYDLPYADIPVDDLTKYQREKIISILKRRLLAYKYAMSKITGRLEELGVCPHMLCGDIDIWEFRNIYFIQRCSKRIKIIHKSYFLSFQFITHGEELD